MSTLDLINITTIVGNIGFSIYLKNSYAMLGWICALALCFGNIIKEQ